MNVERQDAADVSGHVQPIPVNQDQFANQVERHRGQITYIERTQCHQNQISPGEGPLQHLQYNAANEGQRQTQQLQDQQGREQHHEDMDMDRALRMELGLLPTGQQTPADHLPYRSMSSGEAQTTGDKQQQAQPDTREPLEEQDNSNMDIDRVDEESIRLSVGGQQSHEPHEKQDNSIMDIDRDDEETVQALVVEQQPHAEQEPPAASRAPINSKEPAGTDLSVGKQLHNRPRSTRSSGSQPQYLKRRRSSRPSSLRIRRTKRRRIEESNPDDEEGEDELSEEDEGEGDRATEEDEGEEEEVEEDQGQEDQGQEDQGEEDEGEEDQGEGDEGEEDDAEEDEGEVDEGEGHQVEGCDAEQCFSDKIHGLLGLVSTAHDF